MGRKLDNAIALYLEGIRDGKVREAVTKYTGDRYTQHSTGVADGVEGFVEFFEPFVKRNPNRDIHIVRALEDGRYVFVQAYQDINNGEAKWITTDLFDTDENDKIIEHWDVIAPVVESRGSGHSQIDGPTKIDRLDQTGRNKAVVRSFLEDVLQAGRLDRIDRYISADSCVQHNGQIGDGIEGLKSFVQGFEKSGSSMRYENIHRIVGQGNFVVSFSEMAIGTDRYAVFDIFRLEDGFIVEHWDNMEMVPPEDQWGNNGKF